MTARRLSDLLGRATDPDPMITGVTADSRRVAAGSLFVAIPGTKADGASFVPAAVTAGAVAVVAEADLSGAPLGAAIAIRVPDARAALASIAARFHPRQPSTIVAVTGTAGKSSVADFTRQILAACGRAAASLGTLGVVKPDGATYGSLTTPDPVTLHATLDDLAAENVTHLAMEASSHGIEQKRLDGVRLAAAAFTNLGRDHLDYHATLDAYFQAKMRLFDTLLPPGAPAVIDLDGERGPEAAAWAARAGRRVLGVGRAGDHVRIEAVSRDGFAQNLRLAHAGRTHAVRLPLLGTFQADNAVVALGLALAVGEEPESVFRALEDLKGVPGRLEVVGETRGAIAVVDYAHKPEALEAALGALRPFATGRLICVFGCGGDRDRGKRPIMGAIATRIADIVIVTDDNPRTEDPASIRAAILAAAPGAREIGDRAEAIRSAVGSLAPGDVLIVAGKGHETGQIVGDRTIPFSDQDEVRAAIRETAP